MQGLGETTMQARAGKTIRRSGSTSAVLLAGAVGLLALPSAVLALSNRFDPAPLADSAETARSAFQPAMVDPRLARSISVRALAKGQLFRFTPAASPNRLDRSVTVAVRFDQTHPIVVRGPLAPGEPAGQGLRIAPTVYSLGAARGYQSFAKSGVTELRKADMPDLTSYVPNGATADGDPSRFAPRVVLDERQKSGRSPRTFEQSDQSVDLGGSYRLSRNINVTAGVRVTSDRDRLKPLSDARQDNQAVYVGTQFKF